MSISKKLNARSLEISKTVKGLDKQIVTLIQEHLKQILAYVIQPTEDVSPCLYFFRTMSGNADRQTAIKVWLSSFAFTTFSEDDSGKVSVKLKRKAFDAAKSDAFKTHINTARSTMWNTFVPEKKLGNIGAFNIDELLAAAVERIEAESAKVEANSDKYVRQTDKAKALNVTKSAKLDAIKAVLTAKAA